MGGGSALVNEPLGNKNEEEMCACGNVGVCACGRGASGGPIAACADTHLCLDTEHRQRGIEHEGVCAHLLIYRARTHTHARTH